MVSVTELRKPKIWNMAIFDITATFIGAFIVHILLWIYPLEMSPMQKKERTLLQYIASLLFIFVMFLGLGIIFHRIFGIKSGLSDHLGLSGPPFR